MGRHQKDNGMFLNHNKALWIVSLFFSIIACASEQIEPEIYLIPESYVGDIYIIYNVKTGSNPEYEGDARLFRVPDTGVIHTSLPLNKGRRGPGLIQFLQVSVNGDRTVFADFHAGAIEDSSKNRSDKKTYIMGGGFGEYAFSLELKERGCGYNYQSFYVGKLLDGLKGIGQFRLGDYYSKHGYPCDGEIISR
jgi:hypothetical protein